MSALDAASFAPCIGGTLLDNCRLLDGTNPYVERGSVLFNDGEVKFAGRRDDLPQSLAAGAQRVDMGGLTVMPGLIDCHAHLVYSGFRSLEEVDRSSIEVATLNAALNARKVIDDHAPRPGALGVEIGSNDGTLLRACKEQGYRV